MCRAHWPRLHRQPGWFMLHRRLEAAHPCGTSLHAAAPPTCCCVSVAGGSPGRTLIVTVGPRPSMSSSSRRVGASSHLRSGRRCYDARPWRGITVASAAQHALRQQARLRVQPPATRRQGCNTRLEGALPAMRPIAPARTWHVHQQQPHLYDNFARQLTPTAQS